MHKAFTANRLKQTNKADLVIFVPLVISEHLFLDVFLKMCRTNRNVSAFDGSFEKRPKVFDVVGMDVLTNIGHRMIDNLVSIEIVQIVITAPFVGHNLATGLSTRGHKVADGFGIAALNVFRGHFTATLNHTENRRFMSGRTSLFNAAFAFFKVHILRIAAYVGFVSLDSAGKLLNSSYGHSGTDAVQNEPRGLLSDTDSTVKFIGTDAVFGVDDQPHSEKPLFESDSRILKDSADLNRELLFALFVFALPYLTGFHKVIVGLSAFWANCLTISPTHCGDQVDTETLVTKGFSGFVKSSRQWGFSNFVNHKEIMAQ